MSHKFSLLVGLLAGIVAGAAIAAAVAFGLSGRADPRLRRLAGGMAGFGVAFLAPLVGLTLVGLVVAVVSYLRGSTTPDSPIVTAETN